MMNALYGIASALIAFFVYAITQHWEFVVELATWGANQLFYTLYFVQNGIWEWMTGAIYAWFEDAMTWLSIPAADVSPFIAIFRSINWVIALDTFMSLWALWMPYEAACFGLRLVVKAIRG